MSEAWERERRTQLGGSLQYTTGCGEAGQATWLNISRTGAGLLLGRYLRPGRTLLLELAATETDCTVLVPAEVAWCVPQLGKPSFKTGLRIHRDDPEVALHFAKLGYRALAENKNGGKTVVTAVWTSLNEPMHLRHNTAASNLTHAV